MVRAPASFGASLAAMTSEQDPVRLLREAWCIVPLTAIRDFVRKTIGQLGKIKPDDLLGRAVCGASAPASMDPVWQALQTCSDELRCESGIAIVGNSYSANTDPAGERAASQSGWSAVYQEALAKYRAEAGRALQGWLEPLKPPTSSDPPGK